MLLIIGIILIFVFALFINSLFRPTNCAVALLGIFLLSYANVVFVSELAGILYQLNSPIFFLVGHLALAVLGWISWQRAGKPPLFGPLADLRRRITGQALLDSLKTSPELWLLGLCIFAAYLIGALLILNVPPNSGDSLETYLARVGYWLQHGSFYPWPAYYISQILYPINAQCQVLWTVLFWGTDQLAGFVQWLSVPMAMLAIFGLARFFGWSRVQAAFAALIWSTFPQIVLQATSTQNDLIVSALSVSMVYLLYFGLKTNQRSALILSGLALGLALGTKQTVFFIMPGLCLMIVMVWIKYGRSAFRQLYFWALAGLGAFMLVGAFIYVFNFFYFGGAFGPPEVTAGFLDKAYAAQSMDYMERIKTAFIMLIRYCYNAVDVTGLPDIIANPIHRFKGDLCHHIFSFLGLPVQSKIAIQEYAKAWAFDLHWRPEVHEHNAWYGPISWLVLYPAILWQFWKGLLKRDPYRMGLIAMLVGIAFPLCLSRAWGGTEGRYFMLGITLCAPFMAPVFRRGRVVRLLRWGIIILSIAIVTLTTISNRMKPMIGHETIWGKDRLYLQTMGSPSFRPTIRALDQIIPAKATVGFTRFGTYEYFLFGKELERRVTFIEADSRLNDPNWLEKQGFDYIIVRSYSREVKAPPGYGLLGRSGYNNWMFNFFGRGKRSGFVKGNRVPRDEPLLTVDGELQGHVGASAGLLTPRWGLERWGLGSALWLGTGEKDGLGGMLWSDASWPVLFMFDVAPGPARKDSRRRVELTVRNKQGTQGEEQRFDRESQLVFEVQLGAGRNDFEFKVLDQATVTAGNDTRTLLVYLTHLNVMPISALLEIGQAGPLKHPLVTIDSALRHKVGITPQLKTGVWGIEHNKDRSWLWLGEGDREGLGGTLWSNSSWPVLFMFDVAPGPARKDSRRRVELTVRNKQGTQGEEQRFDRESQLVFEVQLGPGRNDFEFKVLDQATVTAGNDTRTLLVYLTHLNVMPISALLEIGQAGPLKHPLVTIDSALRHKVGITPQLKTGVWGIEHNKDRSWLWLGEGDREGLGGTLWSNSSRPVILAFDVAPGPARQEPWRRVELTVRSGERIQRKKQRVGRGSRLYLEVQLMPGQNNFNFKVLDKATVAMELDQRPLLLNLLHLTVMPAPQGLDARSYRFSHGWHEEERKGQDWWRWTGERGQLIIFAEKSLNATLTGELITLKQPNQVDVVVNGKKVVTWDVEWKDFGRFEQLLLDFGDGENVVEIVSHNPAGIIDGDKRPLAIAVKNLILTGEDGSLFRLMP